MKWYKILTCALAIIVVPIVCFFIFAILTVVFNEQWNEILNRIIGY